MRERAAAPRSGCCMQCPLPASPSRASILGTMRRTASGSSLRAFLAGSLSLMLLVGLSMPVQGAVQTLPRPQRHHLRHTVLTLEQQWRAALLRQDVAALSSLLNPNYVGINANGALQTRDDTLTALRSGSLRITQLTLSDQKVRLFRQTAVVTSVAELHGTSDRASLDGRYRYTHVYVRTPDGHWTIASFEASRVTNTQPRDPE